MTRFEQIMDVVHVFAERMAKLTKPKRKWKREHLSMAMNLGTTVVTALAVALPQVRVVAVVANIVNVLQKTLTPDEATPGLGQRAAPQAVTAGSMPMQPAQNSTRRPN